MNRRHILFSIFILLFSWVLFRFFMQKILDNSYNRSFGNVFLKSEDSCLRYKLRPSFQTIVWGEKFSTNAQGCRVNTSRSGRKRKLWLGDSVTMGCGVPDSAHFVYLYGLSDSLFHHENPSVAGWSTADYRCYLESYAAIDSLEEVNVLYCVNDIYGKRSFANLPDLSGFGDMGKWMQWVKDHFPLVKWLSLWRARNSDHYARYDLSLYADHPEWVLETIQDIRWMAAFCEKKGIKFQFVLLPYRSMLTGRQLQLDLFLSRLSAGGIRVIDGRKLEIPDDGQRLYLWSDEIHFSAEGHEAVADFLLKNNQ